MAESSKKSTSKNKARAKKPSAKKKVTTRASSAKSKPKVSAKKGSAKVKAKAKPRGGAGQKKKPASPSKDVKTPVTKHEEPETVLESAHPQDQVSFGKLIDWVIDRDKETIKRYVGTMRARYPKLGKEDLARKITSRRALKSGLVGALTTAGGLPSLPFTVPISVVVTWRIQVFTIMAVADVFGHLNKTEDIRTDVYLILAGDAAKETLKRMGVEVSKDVTRYSVRSMLNKNTIAQANRLLGPRILSATGKKSLVRLVPVIGAAVGFIFDWTAAQAFGKYALRYYGEK